MCIICVKPQGAKLPTNATIHNMFDNNPHGAGFMYARDGKVEIRKGFMDYLDFKHELDKAQITDADALVMHFRITTHGGTCPQNTHPFPVTDVVEELRSLHTSCELGVAHNGIIQIECRSKDISDTQEFIASILTPVYKSDPKFYESERIRDAIRDCINGSRLAFLTGDGTVKMIGSFIEEDGVFYSNDSYQPFDMRWLAWLDYESKRDIPPTNGRKRRHKTRKQRKAEKREKREQREQLDSLHTSVRMPWEQDSTVILKLMPLRSLEYVIGEEGVEYDGIYHAIDRLGRIFYIDPENALAYETYDTVQNGLKFDKSRADYFELQ